MKRDKEITRSRKLEVGRTETGKQRTEPVICNLQTVISDQCSVFSDQLQWTENTSSVFQNIELKCGYFSSFKEEYSLYNREGGGFVNQCAIKNMQYNLPPHRCKRGTPLLGEEGKSSCYDTSSVFQNMELECGYFSSSQEEYAAKLWEEVDSKLVARNSKLAASLLKRKYNNPPLRRVTGTTKNAHLSMLEIMGSGDNYFFPFFLIFSTLFISSPCGGSPEGEGGLGTVTNNLKPQVAYET